MPHTTADELERSRSWWESCLLAFELGDLGAGPRCAASDMTGPRSARDWVVDGVFFGYAVLAAVATAVNDRAEISTTLLVVNLRYRRWRPSPCGSASAIRSVSRG
jgi:hypothetical protein